MPTIPTANSTILRVIALAVLAVLAYLLIVSQTEIVTAPVATMETADVLTSVPAAYEPEKVEFAVRAGDEVIPYRVMGLFVMPGEEITLTAASIEGQRAAALEAEGGTVEPLGSEQWRWTAPKDPGLYPLTVQNTRTGEAVRLNAFVMTPFAHTEERIGSFQVGRYQEEPLRGNPAYERPQGFVEVTPENQNTLVSPHFTVGQFVSKQSTAFPKYVALRERLLMKLEVLLEEVNERGIRTNSFHVMSAFRTPFYNASIGNDTEYSMHLYGGAADIFVDTDGNRVMDDLNRDGSVSVADARFLADIVEDLRDEPSFQPLLGGLGIYDTTPSHGPFIHVDVRGLPVNW